MSSSLWSIRSWHQVHRSILRTSGGAHKCAEQVQVRFKGGVLPHRKPRWIPVGRSRLYVNPKKDFTPQSEVEQRNVLKVRYREHFSALTQFLYEDYLKNSDTGEAAKVEAAKEEEAHARLIRENEETNERVAAAREERLEREMAEERERIGREKEEFARAKAERRAASAEIVRRETESLKDVVMKAEDLEEMIGQALDNPVDYEYAIDKEGHIYRGRHTKSVLVPPAEREKIPTPPNKHDLLREFNKEN